MHDAPPDSGAENLTSGAPDPASPVSVAFHDLPPVPVGGPWRAELWLAWGHLRAGSGERFVSLITALSILGVVLGVAVLDCVLAVMSGFEVDLRDKILGANAHIVVMRLSSGVEPTDELFAKIESIDGVEHASPFIYSEVMLRSRFGTSGAIYKGIDPVRTGDVIEIRNQLTFGLSGPLEDDTARLATFASLGTPITGGGPDGDKPLPGILLGDELSNDLQVAPGDVVQVINPIGTGPSLLGMPSPSVRTYRVAGLFHSGMYEYDTKWTYVAIPEAQSFLQLPSTVTGVEVRVDDIDEVEPISREIERKLGYPFYARHWRNLNQALFEALALEKVVMGVILGMISVVAGLLIISNLYMLVLSKRREIAILKAMGASRGSVLRVFLLVGAVIGVVGASLGTLIGYAGCQFLAWYEWPLETDVYYLSSLPVVFEPVNFVVSAAMALLICLVATLYPAWRAASLDPVEGLRYE